MYVKAVKLGGMSSRTGNHIIEKKENPNTSESRMDLCNVLCIGTQLYDTNSYTLVEVLSYVPHHFFIILEYSPLFLHYTLSLSAHLFVGMVIFQGNMFIKSRWHKILI